MDFFCFITEYRTLSPIPHPLREGKFMKEEKKILTSEPNDNAQSESAPSAEQSPLSETWAQDALQDLEDWIEEQGIYIRQ